MTDSNEDTSLQFYEIITAEKICHRPQRHVCWTESSRIAAALWVTKIVKSVVVEGRIGVLPNGQRHIGMKVIGTNLCANVNHWCHLFHPNLFRRSCNKIMHLVAGCVMKGSITFCQRNIHFMGFHGGYVKRCLLTHKVSQILELTKLISQIKYISANRVFFLQSHFIVTKVRFICSPNPLRDFYLN